MPKQEPRKCLFCNFSHVDQEPASGMAVLTDHMLTRHRNELEDEAENGEGARQLLALFVLYAGDEVDKKIAKVHIC